MNEKYSKEFFEFFQKSLGVPANRGYILFNDPGRANIGYAPLESWPTFAYFHQSDMTALHLPPFLEGNENSSEDEESKSSI